jgi:chromosome partitioning protein
MAKRVSIINFKGGVGKTTLAFHLATGLVRYHQAKVLLIDVDHQSTLSILCLGGDKWDEKSSLHETINSVFTTFTDKTPMPNREIIVQNPLGTRTRNRSSKYQSLDMVPATLDLDDTEIELASASSGNPIRSEWDKRTLLCKWLDSVSVDDEYDYIIIDCPPATKLVTQNAIACSQGYVIPAIPEAVIIRGVPHLRNLLANRIEAKLRTLSQFVSNTGTTITPSYVPQIILVGIVITRIQTSGVAASGYVNDHTEHLHTMETQWSSDMVQPYIPQGVGIAESLRASLPVYSRAGRQNIDNRDFIRLFKDLIDNLKERIDRL